jgi:hypothetical protein
MKTALQEAEEAEGEDGKEVKRDAKGKEILTEEEKARKEEKERKATAEVTRLLLILVATSNNLIRKPKLVPRGYENCQCISWSAILSGSDF